MTYKPSQPGIFTISLDSELYWGVRDKVDLDTYHARLLGVRGGGEARQQLLEARPAPRAGQHHLAPEVT